MGRGEAGWAAKFFAGVLDLEGGVTQFRCWRGAGVFEAKKKQYPANFRVWAGWGAPFEAQGKAVLRPYMTLPPRDAVAISRKAWENRG